MSTRYKGPCFQFFLILHSEMEQSLIFQGGMLTCFNLTINKKSEKEIELELSSRGLDYLVAKSTVMVATQIFKLSCKIMSIKNYRN